MEKEIVMTQKTYDRIWLVCVVAIFASALYYEKTEAESLTRYAVLAVAVLAAVVAVGFRFYCKRQNFRSPKPKSDKLPRQ